MNHKDQDHTRVEPLTAGADGQELPQSDNGAVVTADERTERLADYAHQAWSGWMRYFFSRCEKLQSGPWAGCLVIPREWRARWRHQMHLPYAMLSEAEKESDRAEARKMLDIIGAASAGVPAPRNEPAMKTCARCGKPANYQFDGFCDRCESTDWNYPAEAAVGVPAPPSTQEPNWRRMMAVASAYLRECRQEHPSEHAECARCVALDDVLAQIHEMLAAAGVPARRAPQQEPQDEWNGDMQGSLTSMRQICGCVLGQYAKRLFTCKSHREAAGAEADALREQSEKKT